MSEIREITVQELKEIQEGSPDVRIIDVREVEEYADGHAKGAVNLPLSTLQPESQTYGKEETLYFICRSGARSMRAAEAFQAVGFQNVVNIAGGTLAWQEAEFPMG